jgi:hypothetical protein
MGGYTASFDHCICGGESLNGRALNGRSRPLKSLVVGRPSSWGTRSRNGHEPSRLATAAKTVPVVTPYTRWALRSFARVLAS